MCAVIIIQLRNDGMYHGCYDHPVLLYCCAQDVLSRFSGSWKLTPIRDRATNDIIGTKGVLDQDVLPKGAESTSK